MDGSFNTEIYSRAAKVIALIQKSTDRIKEVDSLMRKRYNLNDSDNKIDFIIKPVPNDHNFCAISNVQTLKY